MTALGNFLNSFSALMYLIQFLAQVAAYIAVIVFVVKAVIYFNDKKKFYSVLDQKLDKITDIEKSKKENEQV